MYVNLVMVIGKSVFTSFSSTCYISNVFLFYQFVYKWFFSTVRFNVPFHYNLQKAKIVYDFVSFD